jgi:hypothetical protein
MSGFVAEVVWFVACLIGAACLGTSGAAFLIEMLSRRK